MYCKRAFELFVPLAFIKKILLVETTSKMARQESILTPPSLTSLQLVLGRALNLSFLRDHEWPMPCLVHKPVKATVRKIDYTNTGCWITKTTVIAVTGYIQKWDASVLAFPP